MKPHDAGMYFEFPDPDFLLSQFEGVYLASVNKLTPEGVLYNALEKLTTPPQENFFDPRTVLHLFKPVTNFSKEELTIRCGNLRFYVYPHSLSNETPLTPFLVPSNTPPMTSLLIFSKQQQLTPITPPVIKASTQQLVPATQCKSLLPVQQHLQNQQMQPNMNIKPLNINISKHRFVIDIDPQIQFSQRPYTAQQFKQQVDKVECFESEPSDIPQQQQLVRVPCLESELSENSLSKHQMRKQLMKTVKPPKNLNRFFKK